MISNALKKLNLTEDEKKTLRLLLIAAFFGGMMQAVWVLIPEVIRNTLQADKVYIVIITLLWPVGQLFAAYWSAYLDGKADKSRVLIAVALLGRFPLVFSVFFSSVDSLLVFFTLFVVVNPVILGSQHAIMQSNFAKKIRGKLYSYIVLLQTLTSLVFVLIFGIILDKNPQNYKLIIIIAALAGTMEAISLSRIKISHAYREIFEKKKSLWKKPVVMIIKPWRDLVRLFKEDKNFFLYEVNFFVYGIGFMILQPFITIFIIDDLSLTYTQVSLSKGTILQAGVIILAPLAGRIFDKHNPVLFSGYIFLVISIFPILLMLIGLLEPQNPQWYLYLSYGFLSIGWSGLVMTWNLGSMFFANERDVARYTGTHVVMVGVRGLMALVVTILLVDRINTLAAFGVTAVLWLLAAGMMFYQWKTTYSKTAISAAKSGQSEITNQLPPKGRPGS